MAKKLVCYLLALILAPACKETVHTPQKSVHTLDGYWYKRYVGTIAGQPVIAGISCCGDHTAIGSYYYTQKSEILYLSLYEDTTNLGHVLAGEIVITDRKSENEEDNDSQPANTWDIVFNGNHISGKFHKYKETPTYNIDLHEDYSGAYQLDIARHDDSIVVKGRKWEGDAWVSCIGVMPTSAVNRADADFINKGILQLLNEADSGFINIAKVNDAKDYQKKYTTAYLQQYEKNVKTWQTNSLPPEPLRRFEQRLSIEPMYNANGILVLDNSWYDYSGGAHGNYGSSYINLDVREKKILNIGDIMRIDSNAIGALLNRVARNKFHQDNETAINDFLNTDTVPVTNNIIISDRGITFCYSTMEIATIPEGNVKLFIPYTKLKSLLKPGFVARMGLKL